MTNLRLNESAESAAATAKYLYDRHYAHDSDDERERFPDPTHQHYQHHHHQHRRTHGRGGSPSMFTSGGGEYTTDYGGRDKRRRHRRRHSVSSSRDERDDERESVERERMARMAMGQGQPTMGGGGGGMGMGMGMQPGMTMNQPSQMMNAGMPLNMSMNPVMLPNASQLPTSVSNSMGIGGTGHYTAALPGQLSREAINAGAAAAPQPSMMNPMMGGGGMNPSMMMPFGRPMMQPQGPASMGMGMMNPMIMNNPGMMGMMNPMAGMGHPMGAMRGMSMGAPAGGAWGGQQLENAMAAQHSGLHGQAMP